MKRICVAAAAALWLGGCASMSEEECLLGDWYTVGFADGARGAQAETVGRYRRECAQHGVTVDVATWQDGRAAGLVEFCQPQRGFNLGSRGTQYTGVCPDDLEPEFVAAYRVGSTLHSLRSAVNEVDRRIRTREDELVTLRTDIDDKEATLIADETTVEERVLLLADLKALNERRGNLEANIDQLIASRALRERELADYELELSAAGY